MIMEILGAKLFYPTVVLTVTGVAVGITLFSSLMHRRSGSRKQMDAVRERMEKHQKEYLKATEAKDKKLLAKLDREQAEIMGEVKKNMTASLKPTLMTMPVVLILIWLMGSWFGELGPILELPIGIPFLTQAVEEAGIINGVDWFGLYLVSAIGTALFLEVVLRKLLKM
ncbi:EMC3/TMCO1 family protein [archaeon]